MAINNSVIIIIIVVAFAFYLIYSQTSQQKYYYSQIGSRFVGSENPQPISLHTTQNNPPPISCPQCQKYEHYKQQISPASPQITNVMIDNDNDPYSDPIKKQDLYGIYDPLTYPQLRLPREILDKYNEFYEKNGTYPPFNQATQPLFDNPILVGYLAKQVDENEPFNDNVPGAIPLFRVKSSKNTNRFFYYIIDQRYLSKIELKIPLDNIKINSMRYNNTDFYGIPELYDGDTIEHISIYPHSKFKVKIYPTYHFP
ncbi:MAG: hypothetical protein Satyrvirus4_22 [Satyrvirus sp.]|uniref:Uncharacterized protein n=1 Tax=Satyrvirus sp. TaxID=2487771 RepID=A0A3G5AD28_9VIRU|nr:MAG: hypothetical protein Satyrvirus4_22 [Satyrvirus sp.]